ncbi:MAG: cache domain-containing protein [Lachnospiraceae bacterium]|nr:cache domain-containing protein [Lachnospiraceae bacterium]
MKKNGLYRKLLDTAVIPVVLLGLVIMGFCYFRFTNTIYEETRNNMRDTAETVLLTYDAAYPGDFTLVKSSGEAYDLYKGDTNITTDYSIVDNFARATSTDISLLYLDVRIHTTFASDSGTRLAGISTNSETSDLVLNKEQEVFYKNITILNGHYLVLYVPVRNSGGSVVGMLEIAKNQHSLRVSVLKAVWPILLLVLLGVLLAAFTAYKSTKNMTDDIKVLQQFLNKVASGSLSVDLDRRLVKRNDEIGDISKSSLAM